MPVKKIMTKVMLISKLLLMHSEIYIFSNVQSCWIANPTPKQIVLTVIIGNKDLIKKIFIPK